MIDLTIKAETQVVADTTKMFLTTYKEQLTQFINQVVGSTGAPVDAGVQVVGEDLVVYEMNPDKGFVIGEVVEGDPIEVIEYKYIPDGNRYVTLEGDRIFLFIKEPQGTPDPKLGAFKTLNDAVKEFNSESVKTAMKNYADKKAAEAKTEKRTENRLKRLGKLESTDEGQVLTEETTETPETVND